MRMRKKKNGAQRLAAASRLLCTDPETVKSDPQRPFGGTPAALHLEIGCGKGKFSVEMAAKHKDIHFYAVERVTDVMICALERALQSEDACKDNLRFILGDAGSLGQWFPPRTFDCIYLNFSDPWPKSGYYKRRLTYRAFLEIYKTLLKPDGVLRLKTDNEKLFSFSLGEFEAAGMPLLKASRDLHHSEYAAENVMTEYEMNFSSQGMPVYFAEAAAQDKSASGVSAVD